jgi:hypothetical protein
VISKNTFILYICFYEYLCNKPYGRARKAYKIFLRGTTYIFFKEDETLPDFVLEGIAKGQEEDKAGRFITHEEFKKRMTSAK